MEKQIENIDEKPAMRLTPRTIAAEIHEALLSYRAEGMIKQHRLNDAQDWWVTWGTTGGFLCGMFLSLVGVAVLA